MNNFYGVKAILDGLKSPSVRSSEKAWMVIVKSLILLEIGIQRHDQL